MCYNHMNFKGKRVVATGKALMGPLIVISCVRTLLIFLKIIPHVNDL